MNFPADLIRSARIRLGLTQAQAAERCGIPLRSYTAYEVGEREPKWGVGTEMLADMQIRSRCATTGNEAGTDDFEPGRPCMCSGCEIQFWRETDELKRYDVTMSMALMSDPYSRAACGILIHAAGGKYSRAHNPASERLSQFLREETP